MALKYTFWENTYEMWGATARTVDERTKPKDLLSNPTPYLRIHRRLSGSRRRISWDNGKTWSEYELTAPIGPGYGPDYMFQLNDPDGLLYRAESGAINKALEKLKDTQFDLGVFLGELPETLAFILGGAQSTLGSFRSACERAERADRARARLMRRPPTRSTLKRINNLTNLIASIWLSYRYGVMPLYYALVDAMKTFEKGLNKPRLVRIRTSSSVKVDGIYHDGEVPTLQSGSAKVRVSINAFVTPNVASSLGLDNPAKIAWELVPLSFVFDWFINVGSFLAGITPRGDTFISGSVSTKVDVQLRREAQTLRGSSPLLIDVGPVTGFCQSYQRNVLSDFPNPRLYWNPNMNLSRYLDAFALLKTIFFKLDRYAVKK